MHRILIVDDDAFHRAGLQSFLERCDYDVYSTTDVESALQAFAQTRFHAAVLDIRLPCVKGERVAHHAGIELARTLKERAPALGVVLLSHHESHGIDVVDMIRDGIRGLAYKTKGHAPDEMLIALRESIAGHVWIDREVADPCIMREQVVSRLDDGEREWLLLAAGNIASFSPREYEIGRLIAASHSVAGIAERLVLAERYVQNTITRIYQKLHLTDLPHKYRKDVMLAKAFLLHQLCA